MKLQILTITEAAERRGISRTRLMLYYDMGRLASLRDKPPHMFDAREVDKLEIRRRGRPKKA